MDSSDTPDDESLWESTTGTFERAVTPPHPQAGRVRAVYREVWDEFFREAHKQSYTSIEELCKRPSRSDHDTSLEDNILQQWHVAAEAERAQHTLDSEDVIMDDDYAPVESYVTIRTERYPFLQEHPEYEACAPCVRNMSFRDGDPASDKETRLHFIPYADRENPKFDYQGYCDEFSEFAWEWDVNDSPDVEAIQGETVRRLHFGHKIDLETINATGVLTALRISNEDGLLWYYAQSDPIPWFKNPNHDYPKLPTTTYKLSDYKERFFNNASLFCGNLNCVMSICPTHPSPTPLREPPKPTKTAAGIRFMVTEACGKDCISVVTDKDRESVPPRDWTESDIQDLKTILMLEPDALPCDLAVLCRKLCWEVYEQRCLLLPDSKISPVTRTHERPSKRIQFRDLQRAQVVNSFLPGPCHHEGACSAKDVDCPCFSAGYHCTTRCYCDTGCLLKWKGCACKGPCHRAQCICWKSGRECDLDVCGCTRSRGGDQNGRFCQNMDIQLGRSVPLEIKVGAFGLGAFAMEDIRTGTYIGEYVGELGLESCDFRWPLREFVHRNYKFSMNEVKDRDDLSLYSDSARAGNETRYINHPVTRADMNVNASLFLVNGEFRMGIWSLTGIPKGDELFLDYGKDYFPEDSETEEIPVASKRGGRPRKN